MPELPEVEVVRRGLSPRIGEATVRAVEVREPRLRWPVPVDLAALLVGRRLRSLGRRGKYLLLDFGTGTLIVHLGMSGTLRWFSTPILCRPARSSGIAPSSDRSRLTRCWPVSASSLLIRASMVNGCFKRRAVGVYRSSSGCWPDTRSSVSATSTPRRVSFAPASDRRWLRAVCRAAGVSGSRARFAKRWPRRSSGAAAVCAISLRATAAVATFSSIAWCTAERASRAGCVQRRSGCSGSRGARPFIASTARSARRGRIDRIRRAHRRLAAALRPA